MTKQVLRVFLAGLIVGFSVIGCSSEKETKVESHRYVKVKRIGQASNDDELIFHGQLKENKEVDVAFKVAGQVYNVLVNEGDRVKKNQVIARIDPRDYKIQLQSAKAQYKQVEGEYARYKELYAKNKLPVNTLERLEAGYLAAKSAFEAAENALDDTELRAPFDGFVYLRHIENFENVAPGQPIFALLDISHLEVVFSLPESKVNKAKNFSEITIDVANANAYNVATKVLSVNEKANGNDMFDVRLMVEDPSQYELKPGMSAKVKVKTTNANTNSVMVPVESVYYNGDKAFVWVYNQSTSSVKSQAVKVRKIENDGLISIKSGLQGNETIVTAGVYSLTESQQVRILENTNL